MQRESKRVIDLSVDTDELEHRRWCIGQVLQNLRVGSDINEVIASAQKIYDWTLSDSGET